MTTQLESSPESSPAETGTAVAAHFAATDRAAGQKFVSDVTRTLAAARSKAGLSQRRLAAEVGCSQRVIAHIEQDRVTFASLPMLGLCAEALGLHLAISVTLEEPAAGDNP